jgi:hypothetical protein
MIESSYVAIRRRQSPALIIDKPVNFGLSNPLV